MKIVTSKNLFLNHLFLTGKQVLPVSFVVATALLAAITVVADTVPAEQRILEEVIVVAQKRPQNLSPRNLLPNPTPQMTKVVWMPFWSPTSPFLMERT